ncbi:MAG TPA: polyphenol oxidase family protein [Candidatus Limnocylindria bacterium]|nr:polyphenol oxidase family protein [Candidatus Limnocylindria bacterium]
MGPLPPSHPPTPWVVRDGTLRSPLLEARGLVAGFTTRALGSMAGSVYPESEQAANRDALARHLGFDDAIARVKQVHGSSVVRVDRPVGARPEADAMWTDRAGVLLGIAAADCVPVLVADSKGRIGAAHAGWQGTMRGVVGSLMGALKGDGADMTEVVAALGPSIGPCCYVIDESRAKVLRRLGDHLREREGAVAFDLWSANVAQLKSWGVRSIEVAGICTKCGGHDLWSYRARDAEGRYGTQLAFLGRPR